MEMRVAAGTQAKGISRERLRKHGKYKELKGQGGLEMQMGPDQRTTEGYGIVLDVIHS